MPDFLNDTVQTLGDPLRNMMLALQGNQSAPPATSQGVSGALNETLLKNPNDDPWNSAVKYASDMHGGLGATGSPADWAMALAGGGSKNSVINMRGWQAGRELKDIRERNLRNTFAENGGGIIQELPNQWSIGYRPGAHADVNHVLLSPQGGPSLYGRSPADLVKRGFPNEEIPDLLSALRGAK